MCLFNTLQSSFRLGVLVVSNAVFQHAASLICACTYTKHVTRFAQTPAEPHLMQQGSFLRCDAEYSWTL